MFMRPTRRDVVLGAAGVPFALRGAVSAADNWLLPDRREIEAAKLKAAKSTWAKITVKGRMISDSFDRISGAGHTYDLAFHAPGALTTSVDLKAGLRRLGETNGYQHIEQLRSGSANGAWWVRWEADGASLTLRFDGADGTEVFTGFGPRKNPAERVPVIVVRRRRTRATFKVGHEFT